MRRSARESSCCVTLGCGTQVPPAQRGLKAATLMTVGPVKVEFDGVVKSTWNLNRFRLLVPKYIR